ncbi:MAG: cupin domain-containing protein [Planctomycetales bacterium]|nr:cupin domain-containing protein [Planctomycetales bacterium]
MTPDEMIRLLGLAPLPQEGVYYRETYRTPLVLPSAGLPDCYHGDRNASTAIYFLLTPEENSALHILPTDEVFHFYSGDAVQMLLLYEEGTVERPTLGVDLARGERPQVVAPGGAWQGCRLADGGRFALLGCTVAPGFDFRDFHVATHEETIQLAARFPDAAEEIHRLAPAKP